MANTNTNVNTIQDMRSIFGAFRTEGYPTLYNDLSHQIWIDVTAFRLTTVFVAVLVAFLSILPGFRGKQRLHVFLRWTPVIVICYLLIICNFMPYWQVGKLAISTPYKVSNGQSINATIGVYIALRGVNVTLRGDPVMQTNGDVVDYNEHFTWTWLQGKPGFGYDAGPMHRDYSAAHRRGLPYPILWVAETFTIDHGNVRIGRYHRQAGWYAHIFLWAALPLFILANVLFQMVIQYGSLFMIFTGASTLAANVVICVMQSQVPFRLAFQSQNNFNNTQFLTLHYSWCYYINLLNGILCLILGVATFIADLRYPDEAADFFGNDVLQSYEDYFAEPCEEKSKCDDTTNQKSQQSGDPNEVRLRKKLPNPNNLEQGYSQETAAIGGSGLKKRAISTRVTRFQKSVIRKMVPGSSVELQSKSNNDNDQIEMTSMSDNHHHQQQPQHFDTIGEDDETEDEETKNEEERIQENEV